MFFGPEFVERIIDKNELEKMVTFVVQHIGRLEKKGYFPMRIQTGENRVGWLLSEVLAWIKDRRDERDQGLEIYTLKSWGVHSNRPPDDPEPSGSPSTL